MEIGLSILLLTAGAAASFLSAILTNISQEELNKIIENDYQSAKILTELRAHFERDISPFQIIEIILYSATGIILGFTFSGYLAVTLNMVYLIIGLSSVILIFRYAAQALGIKLADKLAVKLKPFLFYASYLTSPVVSVMIFITEKIVGKDYDEASREDINAIVEEAHEEGSIDPGEYRIFKNLIHLANIKVSDVMTPRTVVFSLEGDMTVNNAVKHPDIQNYSRFPVWLGESIDDEIIGYVVTKDILQAALDGRGEIRLRDFIREISSIVDNTELDTALEMFLSKRQHQFIVLDQYGGVVGLITMEDVLESMLGVEIVDEADKFVDLRLLAKQKREDFYLKNN